MSDIIILTEEQTVEDGYPCSGSTGEQIPNVAEVVIDG